MGFIQFLINKLVGYDIESKQKELEQSVSSLQKEREEQTYSIKYLNTRIITLEREKSNSDILVNELRASLNELEIKNQSLTEELCVSKADGKEQRHRTTQTMNQLNAYKTNYVKAKKAKDELKVKFEEEILKFENTLKEKTDECLSLQHKVDSILYEKVELTQQLEELRLTITQKEKETDNYNAIITKLSNKKSEIEDLLAKKELAFESLNAEKVSLHNKLQGKQKLLEQKESEINELNKTLIKLQDESSNSTHNVDEIRELENQIQVLQEHLSDCKREIEIQNSRLLQKEQEVKEIGKSLTDAYEQVKVLQEKIEAANLVIRFKESEIQRIQTEISNQETSVAITDLEDCGKAQQEESAQSKVSNETKSTVSTDDGLNVNELPNKEYSSLSTECNDNTPIQSFETNNLRRIAARAKTKEEEAIELSGNSMMDFPPIINDSNQHVQRSIEYVFDIEGKKIYAHDFFGGTAEEIARKSRFLEEAGLMGKSDFVCGMCHRPVKIAHRTINGKESLFFAHATRNEYCAWIPYTTSSKDDNILIDEYDIDLIETEFTSKPHSRILKEMIFSLLCTPESEALGISDVKCDAIIRSSVPYMKWRRPDISFRYKDRDVVIVMQRKKHDLRMLVDRDVFFRLNNYHVIWVFGADNDVSYDYMRMSNYKNTMFDCHRNVFVFDKEAQQSSEEKNTLCLKYNWLDENDQWAVLHADYGSNGLIADISDFIFDDEYCKPYIKEANEPYFILHPDARKQFMQTRKSREQLMKEFEDKWKGEPSYEEALRMMKLRDDKATPFQYMGLWGFRFNTTTLIQPVFTEKPIDLNNGFFMVKQGETAGVVNYFAEVIMDWTNLKCEKLTIDILNNHVLFFNNSSWGIADYTGNILIQPQFVDIIPWSDTTYRVRKSNLWGLQNIEDTIIVPCIYDSIGDLNSGYAEAILRDKDKAWIKYKGLLDSNGHEIDTNTKVLNDKYIAYERFSRWGVRSTLGQDIIEPKYEEVDRWTSEAIRVKINDKWGVISLPEGNVILSPQYDSIENITDGKAKITYVGITNLVDAHGNILSEESINLQDGFVKSKIGGKWGIEKNGIEIVPHKYDEIGSFRQRLIGVINSAIVKLNAYYDYPLLISGKCSDIGTRGIKIDIAGVSCFMPITFIKNAGLVEDITHGYNFKNIAFGNLIFNQKRYLLRFVSEAQMQKKTSHGDKDSDFYINEIVTGTISEIMRYNTPAGKKKTTKVKVKIEDGRETMIRRRFFYPAMLDIEDFKIGDVIKIQKTGFDDELDQTTWKIIETNRIRKS
jgi:hypothetical protein